MQHLDTLRLRLRLMLWELRRAIMCPRGRHGPWSYFGRTRVCRACHKEEWLSGDGWGEAPSGWAPSTKGSNEPTNGVDT